MLMTGFTSTLKQQLNPPEGGVEKLAGKARRRVMPRHGEEEQRGQTASPPRQRAGSGLTHWVSVIEAQNISQHEASRRIRSGQLLFQGSKAPDYAIAASGLRAMTRLREPTVGWAKR